MAIGLFFGVGKALDERFAFTVAAFFLLFKQLDAESAHSLRICFGFGRMEFAVFTLHVFLQLLLRRTNDDRGLAKVALEWRQRLPLLRKIDRSIDIFAHSMITPDMIFSLREIYKEAPWSFFMIVLARGT